MSIPLYVHAAIRAQCVLCQPISSVPDINCGRHKLTKPFNLNLLPEQGYLHIIDKLTKSQMDWLVVDGNNIQEIRQ